MTKIVRCFCAVILVLVAACSMLPTHKDDLDKLNDDFMLRVRWLDFNGASLHFGSEFAADLVERFADANDLKITHFDMTRIEVDVPQEKVTIHYLLEYYLLPSATVKKKRFSLAWEKPSARDSDGTPWMIVEPFPEIP